MLAHYEVVSQLGKGGMGEVYRARDTKLGRDVALKLLPPELSRDPERLARLRREAKVLASLNHPSIAALYGIEESEGRVLLVMELAEGADLSLRLQKGAIPLHDAMAMALSITDGLEAAHAKSIVHRDLKPANVMLSESGRIKLLDFGLARAFDNEDASGDPMMSPTITSAGMTAAGVILGTAAYMSPEQARGKTIGKQSDIWAFGALFFEMLTGHRLFDGETVSDSIGAILHKDPDWNLLPSDTPPQVIQLLHRCLERDTDRRLRDIGDARVAIIDAQRDPTGSSMGLSTVMQPAASGSRPWMAAAVGILALVLGVLGGMQIKGEQTERPYRVLDLGLTIDPSAAQDDGIQATIAPDGSAVAFTHQGQIWLRQLDEIDPRPIEDSESAFAPFWSPDSREIGWFGGGRLWRAPVTGGRAVAITEFNETIAGGVGASWSEEGRIWFSSGGGAVSSVSARGGQPRLEVAVTDSIQDYHEPHVLPNGDVLVVAHPAASSPATLMLWRAGSLRELFDGGIARVTAPFYDPRGYILFRLTGDDLIEGLWAIEFDVDAGETSGEAFIVQPDAAEATVARDGTMVFVANPRRSDEQVISRFRPESSSRELIVPAHSGDMAFSMSPDQTLIAFSAEPEDGGQPQIWVRDLDRGTESRLTSHDGPAFSPRWSPDGTQLFYSTYDLATATILAYRVTPDGSEREIALGPGFLTQVHPNGDSTWKMFSHGERELNFARMDSTDVWEIPLDDPDGGEIVFGGEGFHFVVGLSPDQRYMLYGEGRDDNVALFLTRYPEIDGRWKVTTGTGVTGGGFNADGSRIYYVTNAAIFEVSFESGESPRLGRPQEVMELPDGVAVDNRGQVAAALDGDGYLIAHPDESASAGDRATRRGVKVVQNWTQKLTNR